MPRSNTPVYSTYKTEQFPLIKETFLRSTNTFDALYENCYVEAIKNRDLQQFDIAATKRDGTVSLVDPTGEFRGMFYSISFGTLLWVVGNTVYYGDASGVGFTPIVVGTLPSSTGEVGFCEYLYTNGTVTIVWADGIHLGEISSSYVLTTSTDVNIPNHQPCPVYLDGYLFLLKTGSQEIYNSVLDNPMDWTGTGTGSPIAAEMSADRAYKIAHISNYIVCLGANSIEFFYDAANATGSPLNRNETVFRHVGYVGGLAQLGNKLYFVGQYTNGELDVFAIEETKLTSIGSQQVTRNLGRTQIIDNDIFGAIVSFNGKQHYVFTHGAVTYAYDVGGDIYSTWKYANTDTFRIQYAANCPNSRFKRCFIFNPDTGTHGRLSEFLLDTYTDNGSPFTMRIRTNNQYSDTLQMKFISRMSLFVDQGSSNATMQLRWTDDDYQTYSNYVPIILNQELASVRRLGGYRRRAFEFSNSENYPIRMWGYELDLNMGAS